MVILCCRDFILMFLIANIFVKCEEIDLGVCSASSDSFSCGQSVPYDYRNVNGGWYTDPTKVIANEGPCNIDTLEYLSQDEFLEKYAYEKPFIVKNPNDNSLFRELSKRETMLKKFGDKVIKLSSANTYSYQKLEVTLVHYLKNIMKPQSLDMLGNETFYWFGDNNHTEWGEVFDTYHPPDLHIPNLMPAFSYGVADLGTGVPFHFHGPGFSEVIYGSKRWFLYPPKNVPLFNPNLTTLHWLVKEYPKLSSKEMPLECTIKPGEALYFPDHWWHATLNINSSVFISTFLG